MAGHRLARGVVAFGALLSAAALAGCSSGGGAARPAFPADPDPCAAYCLKWVPPVYRDVPRVCRTKPPEIRSYEVCTLETRFREVCTPGTCRTVTVPDECQMYNIVQATPARQEWRQVECCDCAGCEVEDCWKRVRVPPTYAVCPRCETKEGYSYCVETPPTYSVVTEQVPRKDVKCEYVPAEYDVKMDREVYVPGHWQWEKRFCPECEPECPPPAGFCAPSPTPTAGCAPCQARAGAVRRLDRPTWGRCPSAD